LTLSFVSDYRFVGAIVEWVRRILALTYLIIPNSPPPILLVMQVLTNKFFNPAFHHLISPIDLSFRIRILLFFDEHLLIMGKIFRGDLLSRAST